MQISLDMENIKKLISIMRESDLKKSIIEITKIHI